MKTPAAVALGLTLVLAASPPAAAHDEAVLKSPQTSVAAGNVVALTGAEFGKGASYTLKLVGALREYTLMTVSADSAGDFSIRVPIEAGVVPGTYKIEAMASDGDVVARLDMTVLAAVPDAMADMQHGNDGMQPEVRADDIRIDRDRSAIEWGVIGLLIGTSAGLGSGLLLSGKS